VAGGIATAAGVIGEIGEATLAAVSTLFYSWIAKDNPTSYHTLLALLLVNAFIVLASAPLAKFHGHALAIAVVGTAAHAFIGYGMLQITVHPTHENAVNAKMLRSSGLAREAHQQPVRRAFFADCA